MQVKIHSNDYCVESRSLFVPLCLTTTRIDLRINPSARTVFLESTTWPRLAITVGFVYQTVLWSLINYINRGRGRCILCTPSKISQGKKGNDLLEIVTTLTSSNNVFLWCFYVTVRLQKSRSLASIAQIFKTFSVTSLNPDVFRPSMACLVLCPPRPPGALVPSRPDN